MPRIPCAVSFDLGQTLVELDPTLLREQVERCGFRLREDRVSRSLPLAWHAYNQAKARGDEGFAAWGAFMARLLELMRVTRASDNLEACDAERQQVVNFLWSEQPLRNLWRKPIEGMAELLADLKRAGTKVGVLTNSEGRARELIEAVGLAPWVQVVVDSGLEGIEKPDVRIFQTMAERLDCPCEAVVHVGDSYEADVLGALRAKMTPIWFSAETTVTLPPGVALCRTVAELRGMLL